MSIPNLELFPSRVQIELSRIAIPVIVLPEDDYTDFGLKERPELPYWTVIWDISVLVGVFKISGHSDFGIFKNNVGASSILTWV